MVIEPSMSALSRVNADTTTTSTCAWMSDPQQYKKGSSSGVFVPFLTPHPRFYSC